MTSPARTAEWARAQPNTPHQQSDTADPYGGNEQASRSDEPGRPSIVPHGGLAAPDSLPGNRLATILLRRRGRNCGVDLQQCLYSFGEPLQVIFKWRRQRIQPMNRAKEILHGLRWDRLFDAYGNNRNAFTYSPLDLAMDLP
jgi:hypothetical protein